MYTLACLFDGV